jgi:hypothetical protein
MRRKSGAALKILTNFQKLLEQKPPRAQMFSELRMMKFKVHPVIGDITHLNFNSEQLIETLWSLGKLDELFQNAYKKLSAKDKRLFIQAFDDIYQKLQIQLNSINLKASQLPTTSPLLEMEIFKERTTRKKLN